MTRLLGISLLALALAAAFGSAARGDDAAVNQEPRVSVTVYNGNFAVVKEDRTIELPKEESVVKVTDVAASILPASVSFSSLDDPAGTRVLEQNYKFDMVNADALLKKCLDRPLTVLTKAGQKYSGTLLSFGENDLVLQTAAGVAMIRRYDNVQDIQFTALPEGLITRPTLVWTVRTSKPVWASKKNFSGVPSAGWASTM